LLANELQDVLVEVTGKLDPLIFWRSNPHVYDPKDENRMLEVGIETDYYRRNGFRKIGYTELYYEWNHKRCIN
jgi:hypothetical protein